MAKEEEFYTDYNYELFTDNDNDDEPSTMSECSLFLVQHMIDDEFVASLMTPQRLIDYINMDDCHGESYEIFNCMSEFGKVKPLRYKGWQPGCLIEVVDEAGKVVLRGYGEDHQLFIFSVFYPARTNRPINRPVVLFFYLFFHLFFVFFTYFFIYFFCFFLFFSLLTNSSLDSPGISVSRKVQFLMPSYTSSSDIELISAGHSSGCSFQRFLCCSICFASFSSIIDGRETAANLRLSVGSEVTGRVREVRNPVHVW